MHVEAFLEKCIRCGAILDENIEWTQIPHTDVAYCDKCLNEDTEEKHKLVYVEPIPEEMSKATRAKYEFSKTLLDGEDPPANLPTIKTIDVRGRKEHEDFIKDPSKCKEFGIDPVYEAVLYLKRWGGLLDE